MHFFSGEFGRYQGFQFFLHILSALTAGMNMLSLVTVAAVPDHRCYIEGFDNSTSATAPWSIPDLQRYIPMKGDVLDSCNMFSLNETNTTVACEKYVYDDRFYGTTRTVEWDHVCDRRWLGAIAQTIYMFGVFTGAVVLGNLADKYGRKAIFCWSGLLQLVLGVGVAFIPEYFSFLLVRYVYGIFGSAGSYITGFVLTMELVGPSKRTVCGISFQAVFALGIMLVASWGALIPNRVLLQVVYGLHAVLLIPHWWLMDESPRWLWGQGRTKEAINIVAKGVTQNRRGIELDKQYYSSKSKSSGNYEVESKQSAGMADLFKTPNIRIKTINACLCWFANSLVYYGLSLSAGKLYGNPFLILFFMGLIEIPSYGTIMILLDKLGRRSITSFLMLIGGACCIVAAFIAQGSTTATTIVMAGKLCIAGSFAVIYNYSAELFPTVIRNSAMGLGSMCARLAGALTPLITLLDSFDPKVPAVIFGCMSLISGFWVLFLPETMNQPMPETIADGETFGKGDTFFTTGLGRRKVHQVEENMVPMETIRR